MRVVNRSSIPLTLLSAVFLSFYKEEAMFSRIGRSGKLRYFAADEETGLVYTKEFPGYIFLLHDAFHGNSCRRG